MLQIEKTAVLETIRYYVKEYKNENDPIDKALKRVKALGALSALNDIHAISAEEFNRVYNILNR